MTGKINSGIGGGGQRRGGIALGDGCRSRKTKSFSTILLLSRSKLTIKNTKLCVFLKTLRAPLPTEKQESVSQTVIKTRP